MANSAANLISIFFSLQLSSLSTVTVDLLWNNLCSHFIGI